MDLLPLTPEHLLALQKLLQKLEQRNKRDSDLVDLYYFAGLSQAEIGQQLAMREEAVKDRLKVIRIWLRKEYLEGAEHPH